MTTTVVHFAVFVMTVGNAAVLATVGLFGRGIGLSEFQVGGIISLSALPFFLTSSWWGRVADERGRRVVILAGLCGVTVSCLLFAGLFTLSTGEIDVATAFVSLLLARAIYGVLCGGVQPAAIAYMADITGRRDRATGAAMVGAAIGLGTMVGPALVALLIGLGFVAPLVSVGFLALSGVVVALAGWRETPRVPAAATAKPDIPPRKVGPYLVLAFVIHFAFAALQATNAFYFQDFLQIDTMIAVQRASLASIVFASCSFAVQAGMIRALKRMPATLLWVGLMACLLASFGLLGAGFALTQSDLVAGASLASGDCSQGHTVGRLHAAMAAAWIVGPLAGAALNEFSIKGPWILAATATALGFPLLVVRSRQTTPEH